ncbi:hypothetical protein [Marinilabilia rubra]|uniref:Uncharacterized protein n=1 Tax=Marinilabilia rubra TaxID=2162893 RepID=A0A2U2B6W1_9BACT|nr:hypothetical protein [Marinilabilia rubra]PWD98797.1 hypothetical protein DDZ16_13745 [Marinilabilia rubra]
MATTRSEELFSQLFDRSHISVIRDQSEITIEVYAFNKTCAHGKVTEAPESTGLKGQWLDVNLNEIIDVFDPWER